MSIWAGPDLQSRGMAPMRLNRLGDWSQSLHCPSLIAKYRAQIEQIVPDAFGSIGKIRLFPVEPGSKIGRSSNCTAVGD